MPTAVAAISAFSATNVDDILLLVLLFSRLDRQLRPFHVVSGQFLGITALVLISLAGFLGRSALPQTWLGLLGLLPISIGLTQLIERFDAAIRQIPSGDCDRLPALELAGVFGVASLTIANGSDNIGVYMPLFASNSAAELLITLFVFALLTGLWCLLAWWLTQAPGVASVLERYGAVLLPPVLIGLGGLVLHNCGTLQAPTLALISLGCVAVMVMSLVRQLQAFLSQDPVAGASQP